MGRHTSLVPLRPRLPGHKHTSWISAWPSLGPQLIVYRPRFWSRPNTAATSLEQGVQKYMYKFDELHCLVRTHSCVHYSTESPCAGWYPIAISLPGNSRHLARGDTVQRSCKTHNVARMDVSTMNVCNDSEY